jgi:acyl-CoA synthetase (AMP-forming)/AMP-acid ligase II
MLYTDYNYNLMQKNFNIVDLFFEAAGKYPGQMAIIDKKRQVTFSELELQVHDTAYYFLKKGIQQGDRVLVFVPMSTDLYRIVLALFKIGATAVFLDEWVNRKRMEECCKITQSHAFIGTTKARIFSFLSPGIRKIPIQLGTKFIPVIKNNLAEATVHSDHTALITFTTGSTGTPKAAKRTHGFLRQQFKVLAETINPQPGETSLPVLPVVLLINLAAGCTSLITGFKSGKPRSMNADKILHQIIFYKVSTIVASPFFIKQLAKCAINQEVQLPSLKKIFTGGAPVFSTEAILYKQAFPKTAIEIVYGSTEAEPISSISVEELIKEKALARGLNVGKPDPNTEVKIISLKNGSITCDDESSFQKLILKAGSVGEIIVSGAHVLDAYFNNEKALKENKIFVGNKCWHRTGDSGFQIPDGTLFLTGRCSTLIHLHNKIIAPFLFENYFQSIDGVEAGTIIEKEGNIIAVIECIPGFNKKKITKLLQKINEPLLPLDTIKWISKMPRDPRHHSKNDYDKLKHLITT